MTDDEARSRQRIIRSSIIWTVPLTMLALIGGYFVVPFHVHDAVSPVSNAIGFALPWVFVAALPYFAVCLTILYVRFAEGAHNPLLGQESERLRLHCRVMQNTLEQLVWTAICLLAIAALVASRSELRIIPLASSLFVIARLVYWWGYTRRGTLGRAPGVQMTFTINGVLLVLTLALFVLRGLRLDS